jgi:hypothetical protein
MHQNVLLNFPLSIYPSHNVQVAELDWGKLIPFGLDEKPDIILAADCVYFEVRDISESNAANHPNRKTDR